MKPNKKKSQENIKLRREEVHIRTVQAGNKLCICTVCVRIDFTPFGIINIYIQRRRQSYSLLYKKKKVVPYKKTTKQAISKW